MADILFKTDDCIFSYRVGGIIINDGKILLQRSNGDEGYAIVGGHVAFGETTDETIVREFKEELGADIKVERLIAVGENFFKWGSRSCHQINLYYLVSLSNKTQIPLEGVFGAIDELGEMRIDLDMCWINIEDVKDIKLYPEELKPYVTSLPQNVVYFAHKE